MVAANMSTCQPAQGRTTCAAKKGSRMTSSEKFVSLVQSVRDPLAEYQEKQGLPKTEQYTFIKLITSLCQHAYEAILTIVTMLYSLLPLFDGFLYLTRFVLDKLIEIGTTECRVKQVGKCVLFIAELAAIVLLVILICGLIIFPVWQLFTTLLGKLWGYFNK